MPSHLGSLELPHTSPHFLEIRRAVRRHTDMHVVVGLSGGPDSVALLAGTLAEGREVEAICIDHGLQDASAEVAATAAETARALGAAATVLRIDVSSTGSMEANARHARYTALTSAANGRPIWVGHTMDDQAETLLLSALRGHATGMLERSTWEDGATMCGHCWGCAAPTRSEHARNLGWRCGPTPTMMTSLFVGWRYGIVFCRNSLTLLAGIPFPGWRRRRKGRPGKRTWFGWASRSRA